MISLERLELMEWMLDLVLVDLLALDWGDWTMVTKMAMVLGLEAVLMGMRRQ